jgi:hypothetical protein
MGGAISMVLKNWKLFVACLSGFWLRKMMLGHQEQKMFPAKIKKWREQMGWTPYMEFDFPGERPVGLCGLLFLWRTCLNRRASLLWIVFPCPCPH